MRALGRACQRKRGELASHESNLENGTNRKEGEVGGGVLKDGPWRSLGAAGNTREGCDAPPWRLAMVRGARGRGGCHCEKWQEGYVNRFW